MLTRDELLNKEIFLSRKAYFTVGLSGNRGANACLEVTLRGKLDPKTELAINLTEVDKHLRAFIDKVDHKHIGKDLKEDWLKNMPKTFKDHSDEDLLIQQAYNQLHNHLNSEFAQLDEVKLTYGQGQSLVLSSNIHSRTS